MISSLQDGSEFPVSPSGAIIEVTFGVQNKSALELLDGLGLFRRAGFYNNLPGRGLSLNQMGKLALRCFGVGDGWPCADRNHASFLYRFDQVSILVDCGEPVSSSYKASGLPYDAIDRIFISHLHFDHIAGFFMLMQGFWLEQRKKTLPVHLPAAGIKPFGQLLNAAMVFKELLQFRLRFEGLRAGKAVVTRGVRVVPYRSSHLAQLKKAFQKKYPQRFDSFSFLIEAGRVRIGHSADLGRPEDLEPLLKKPLDLLVCELAHFKAEDLFRYLKRRDIKRIVFVHLTRPYWENLQKTRQLAAKMLPGIPCSFPRDNEEITI
ncbi:MAG: Beta-lactamase domain protein [Pedosphaera sp.]|nr:Beta-lactamase domain protein [Pedosphaera sp.]